ncbi:hypothetical protein Tco_1214683 [Tanacetum coccineum]
MDDPNITMEEYIRLKEEKARKSIVFNDNLTSNETLSCEPTISSINDNEIDFRISFDEFDDKDYTVVFDKNSFFYKIISTNDLKTDSENDNEKVNVPLFPSPEPTVSCIDDLDFFKAFENEFPAIVYNDALKSKSDFSTKPTLCPQHIDEFDLKDETSLSEYDKVEQNVLYFNDLFHFNIIYPDNLKSNKGNDDNEIDMIQSSGGNEYTQGSNKLLEKRHEAKVVGYTKEIVHDFEQRLGTIFGRKVNRVHILDFRGLTPNMRQDLAERMRMEFILEFFSTCRIGDKTGLDVAGTLCFQLGGARRSMTWRQIILALGLHTAKEMAEDGFGAYWLRSERLIPDKRDLSDYWVEIYFGMDFLRGAPSYTYIIDPIQRLCHRLISYIIYGRGQASEKHSTCSGMLRGRKIDAKLSKGHFVGRLAHHFGLVSDDGLRGLSVVAHELSLIDIGELVKLNFCREIGDDWAWVVPRPDWQQVAVAGAPKVTEDAPSLDEGAQADPVPIQAPQQPPPPPSTRRTMP